MGEFLNTSLLTRFHPVLDQNFVLLGLVLVCSWFAVYFRGNSSKLRHIPTVGSDLPLLSYLGAFRYITDAPKVVNKGVRKWPTAMFKVADLLEWVVVVTEPKVVEEMRKAPDNVLSASESIHETLQTEYTLGRQIVDNPYHVPIVRAQLTRALPQLLDGVREEVVEAFNEFIPVLDDWKSIDVSGIMMKIVARSVNRTFVGLPLCRDPDFVDLNVQFTVDVVTTGAILRTFPVILRPIVNAILSNVPKRIRRGLKHLKPIIDARRKESEEKGKDYPDKPVDVLMWFMDEAKGEEATDWFLTSRILTLNFSTIHTTSMTFTHALYYLALMPEYLKPLREEVEEVVKSEGWTKAGVDQMYKIDSFIKESQRMSPLGSLLLNRVALKDYTFSNGTAVPAGTSLSVSTHHTHFDGSIYEDPTKFDGLRFSKMRERAAEDGGSDKKFDIVSTGVHFLPFGHGRHACPGRFFAAGELKLMLAHLVVTYDVKFEKEGVRPADRWVASACVPNATAEVLFRRRRSE